MEKCDQRIEPALAAIPKAKPPPWRTRKRSQRRQATATKRPKRALKATMPHA